MTKVCAGHDDVGNKCIKGNRPGTVALRDAIIDRYGGRSLGIYACRLPSKHSEGRAYDHAWTVRATGQVIADRLVEKHAELGVQCVIWWERIWTWERRTEGWRAYHGESPHRDHLHMDQNWSGANHLTYEAAIRAITGHATPQPTPTTPTRQEGDDGMFIYSVKDRGSFLFDGDGVVSLDQNALNELRAAGVRDVGDRNAAFHNWAVDAAESKRNAGRV